MTDISNILPGDWDAEKYEGEQSDGVVPAGWYSFRVERQEIRDMKSGNGKKLALAFVIEGPRYANKWVFVDINLGHKNEEIRGYALEEYAQLCRACGVRGNDTSQLVGKKFDGKVTIRSQEGWDDRNEVKAYAKVDSKAIQKVGQAAPSKPLADDDLPF